MSWQPIETTSPEKAVERYRAYYNACKQGFWRRTGQWVPATWEKREVPEWFIRAKTEQPAGRLAQRSVEIDRVHALENAVSARFFDVPNIEINLHPQTITLTL